MENGDVIPVSKERYEKIQKIVVRRRTQIMEIKKEKQFCQIQNIAV